MCGRSGEQILGLPSRPKNEDLLRTKSQVAIRCRGISLTLLAHSAVHSLRLFEQEVEHEACHHHLGSVRSRTRSRRLQLRLSLLTESGLD